MATKRTRKKKEVLPCVTHNFRPHVAYLPPPTFLVREESQAPHDPSKFEVPKKGRVIGIDMMFGVQNRKAKKKAAKDVVVGDRVSRLTVSKAKSKRPEVQCVATGAVLSVARCILASIVLYEVPNEEAADFVLSLRNLKDQPFWMRNCYFRLEMWLKHSNPPNEAELQYAHLDRGNSYCRWPIEFVRHDSKMRQMLIDHLKTAVKSSIIVSAASASAIAVTVTDSSGNQNEDGSTWGYDRETDSYCWHSFPYPESFVPTAAQVASASLPLNSRAFKTNAPTPQQQAILDLLDLRLPSVHDSQ